MKTNFALSLGIAALLGLGAAIPASAGTTAAATTAAAKPVHYYVALKAKGPGCEVVSAKPASKLMVGKNWFKTEAAATKALAADKACKA